MSKMTETYPRPAPTSTRPMFKQEKKDKSDIPSDIPPQAYTVMAVYDAISARYGHGEVSAMLFKAAMQFNWLVNW